MFTHPDPAATRPAASPPPYPVFQQGEPAREGRRPADPSIDGRLVEALDWLEQGVILVDGTSRVLFASASARELLSEDRGLTIAEGMLETRSPSSAAMLRHLIARCASSSDAGGEPGAPLSCRVGEPPLSLLIARAGGQETARAGQLAIVFIVDPSRASLPSARHLRDHFGFTSAEAAVALAVISGGGLKACARRLGVSPETARTHLSRIFAKTGVRRQAELVRLLLLARHTVRQPRGSAPAPGIHLRWSEAGAEPRDR